MARIALFLPQLRIGGAERAMLDLANGFAHAGHEVDLLAGSVDERLAAEACARVRVIDLGVSRILRAVIPLVRYLRSARPRALLSTLGDGNMVALAAHRVARVDTRLVLREANTPSLAGRHNRSVRGRVIHKLLPAVYRAADAVVAVSEGVRNDLCQVSGIAHSRIAVVHNLLPIERISRLAAEPLDDPWFVDIEVPVIVGMGRLTAQKDFATLLRAFAVVRRERPARLVVLGDGEERASLEAMIRDLDLAAEARLVGRVMNPFPYLSRARLFVLSSRWEGFPNALAQALACGTQVVSTNCRSGPAEILNDGELGRLVPVGDPSALAAAILEELATTRCTIAASNRASLARFAEDRVVPAYLDILLGRPAAEGV